MNLKELATVLDRDLRRLIQEVEAYPDDAALWAPGPANPGGNLCQHLCGNLREYIGRILGGVAYERDRPAEFAARAATRAELVALVEETRRLVIPALEGLPSTTLTERYPQDVLGMPMTTGFFLLHVLGHFNYHLGQIDLHRRHQGPAGALTFVR